jgi:hypothetical protein
MSNLHMAVETPDYERLDCGHYDKIARATPTLGGGLICTLCGAELRVHLKREPSPNWRESLERLFAVLYQR